ncbi:hypothetical protein BHM03_00056212 [Ensete ventricosum]|nr:hypothetical protein BHM03_00056212 [Ensete ventricosum]
MGERVVAHKGREEWDPICISSSSSATTTTTTSEPVDLNPGMVSGLAMINGAPHDRLLAVPRVPSLPPLSLSYHHASWELRERERGGALSKNTTQQGNPNNYHFNEMAVRGPTRPHVTPRWPDALFPAPEDPLVLLSGWACGGDVDCRENQREDSGAHVRPNAYTSEPSDGREFLGRDAHVRWRDLVVPMCARPPRRRTDNVRPF